jgi:hypothetical protein
VQKAHAGNAWFVVIGNQAHYRLTPVPVGGQFGCDIVQTVNGKRFSSDRRANSSAEALAAGLEDLGRALGWTA